MSTSAASLPVDGNVLPFQGLAQVTGRRRLRCSLKSLPVHGFMVGSVNSSINILLFHFISSWLPVGAKHCPCPQPSLLFSPFLLVLVTILYLVDQAVPGSQFGWCFFPRPAFPSQSLILKPLPLPPLSFHCHRYNPHSLAWSRFLSFVLTPVFTLHPFQQLTLHMAAKRSF